MAGKKVGSDGQVRKTTAEWSADVNTYPEGMRLMDTDTGVVRTSKGTTYALAWVPASGGSSAWGGITGTLSDQTDLQNAIETLANGIGAIVTQTITDDATTTSPSEDAVFTALAGKADAADLAALATVATSRTGSAIAFDVPAEYNTATSPTSGTVSVDYTGAVAGTQVLLWCNHAAEPSWPAGWTVTGVWDNSALNAVILTYRTGTTVSGYIVSGAQGAATNPSRVYCLTADFAVTSATPLKVAGIEGIPVLAGKLYAIEWYAKGTCSGTSGGYFGLWANTGTDHDLFMAGRTDFAADAGVYFSIGANSGYNSAATSYPWFAATLASNFGRCAGTILGGAVDATFEMRARSVNAAQTFTVTRRGTWFRITPLD